LAIVTNVGAGCGGRGSVGASGNRRADLSRERYPLRKTTAPKRTAKPRGPGTRCWCQIGGGFRWPNRARKTFNPPMTVTRRIRRRGERGISRKTTVQGMPECSDCTCMLVCAFSAHIARETAGAASTRHSLRPLPLGAKRFAKPGRNAPRECGGVFNEYGWAPPPRSSSPAHVGDPVFRGRQRWEPKSRGVRDTRLRLYDSGGCGRDSGFDAGASPGMTLEINPLLTIHTAKIA
jgi:hypothetical protein